jgi:hypothetical protein
MRVSVSAVVAVSIATLFTIACSQSASPTRPSSTASGTTTKSLAITQYGEPSQVLICHFEGHESSTGVHDWVIATMDGTVHPICDSLGGVAMWVGRAACREGHAAVNSFGADCDAQQPPQ